MNSTKTFLLIATAILMLWCSGCGSTSMADASTIDEQPIAIEYAQGYRMAQGEGYTRIDIVNPWDTTTLLHTYILIDSQATPPQELPQGVVIRTPLRNSLIFSSVHCSLLAELQCLDAIGGICDSEYNYIEELQSRLQAGTLADAGNSTSPDIEQIIDLNPDAILLSPFENLRHERLEKTGIPIIECADYMENTPLGRAEWMRLIGRLYGRAELADSLFNHIKNSYLSTAERLATVQNKPLVITERRIGQVWYIPGGKSYMARLLSDAGAQYPWSDNNNTGSIALSFESVLERGQNADFWLIKYHAPQNITYSDIKQEYAPNARFKAFEQRHIYGCNTQYLRYYEETPFHPEQLLQDLGAIFHPSLFTTHQPYYFFPIDE
ncbi:MAG: ABC transporter substrate-binding protein [Bacteroidales bacterium]|nr:ABC transporter substrate-binding protein [Bacteroidales bacterium]